MEFLQRDLEEFWNWGKAPRRLPANMRKTAFRKLQMLDAATALADLRVSPGNRLEKLQGSRAGQHSIRVNDQWRLCFVWTDEGAKEVELCDCH